MSPTELRRLVMLHADLLAQADRSTRAAARLDRSNEVERAEVERDEAAELRDRAEALAALLKPHGVLRPDPRQLSLLADGGAP